VLAAIEWGKLAELLYVAPLAGLVVAVTFAIVIFGAGRVDRARREGDTAAATLFGAIALAGLSAFLGAVVFSLTVIAS
jgi:hypothetical protein